MDKALKADEVYKIARPVIDVHLKDVKESRRESDDIAKLNEKILRQEAEINSSLLKIYVDNRKDIIARMTELVNSKDKRNRAIVRVLTDNGVDPAAAVTAVENEEYDAILIDLNRINAVLEKDLEPYYINIGQDKLLLNQILLTSRWLSELDNAGVFLKGGLMEPDDDDIEYIGEFATDSESEEEEEYDLGPSEEEIEEMRRRRRGDPPSKPFPEYTREEQIRIINNIRKSGLVPERLRIAADRVAAPLINSDPEKYIRITKANPNGFKNYEKDIKHRLAKNQKKYDEISSKIVEVTSIIGAVEKTSGVEESNLRKQLDESAKEIVKTKESIDKSRTQLLSKLKEQDLPNVRINRSNRILREHQDNLEIKPGRVIKFEDIAKYDTIEDLMEDDDMLLIIYRYREMFGHWVGLFRNSYGLNYFNSSGTYIDKAIDGIPHKYKHESGQNFPHLLQLLRNAHSKVYFNDVKIQGDNTNTCGRWVGYCFNHCAGENGSRMEDFVAEFSKTKNPDKVIVALTDPLLEAQKDISYPVTFL